MWRFRAMRRDEVNVEPIQGEFFSSEDLGELSEILCRECIQNSLDARHPGRMVKVRFHLGRLTGEDAQEAWGTYLGELWPHLSAETSGIRSGGLPREGDAIQFLAVEDSGTKGLEGDPNFDDQTESGNGPGGNDFFYFWRNVGRNDKGEESMGSWGLGKQVFPASSRINSFFGSTVVRTTGKRLLMGASVLKIHHVSGRKVNPYGYFGVYPDDSDFAMPFETEADLQRFSRIFSLSRGFAPGLSVVIPFPKAELQPEALLRAVIRHYYYPILKGDLSVEVSCYGDSWPGVTLTRENLTECAAQHLPDERDLHRILDVASWAASNEIFTDLFEDPDFAHVPKWPDTSEIPDVFEQLRERFDADGRIAVRVHMWVRQKSARMPTPTHFDVYLAKSQLDHSQVGRYLRRDIEIANANAAPLPRGIIGICDVQERPLSALLRLCEPPAHDKWELRNNDRLKQAYEKGTGCASFVRKSITSLQRLLAASEGMRDRDLLRDLFYVDLGGQSPRSGAGRRRRKKKPRKPDVNAPSRRPMVRTHPINEDGRSGFRVVPAGSQADVPVTLTVQAAYVVSTGSPLRRYSELDFTFGGGGIEIDCHNARVDVCSGNLLVLSDLRPGFELRVTGFDANRDLFLNVDPVRQEDEEEQGND